MKKYKALPFLNAVHGPDGPSDPRLARVLTVLALHRNFDTGKCCPSVRTIAERAHMNKNTVLAKLKAAEEAGWVCRTVHRTGSEHGAWTEYRLKEVAEGVRDTDTPRQRKGPRRADVEDSDPVDMRGAKARPELIREIIENRGPPGRRIGLQNLSA